MTVCCLAASSTSLPSWLRLLAGSLMVGRAVTFSLTETFQVFITLRKRREANERWGEGREGAVGSAVQDRELMEYNSLQFASQDTSQDHQGDPHCCQRTPPGALDAGGRASAVRPAGSSLHLGVGRMRPGTRQSLPGANARHKSSVSLRSDFQSCRDGIIKRN